MHFEPSYTAHHRPQTLLKQFWGNYHQLFAFRPSTYNAKGVIIASPNRARFVLLLFSSLDMIPSPKIGTTERIETRTGVVGVEMYEGVKLLPSKNKPIDVNVTGFVKIFIQTVGEDGNGGLSFERKKKPLQTDPVSGRSGDGP